MPDTPALPPLPDFSLIERWLAFDRERGLTPRDWSRTVVALIAHLRALQAENERLLAIIDRGRGAINAAIEQTQAEYANHDTRAERYYLKVEAWRQEARAALAASRREG